MSQPLGTERPRKRRHAVQFIAWTANGTPLSERIVRELDDALVRITERSRTRILTSVVRADLVGWGGER